MEEVVLALALGGLLVCFLYCYSPPKSKEEEAEYIRGLVNEALAVSEDSKT